MIFEALGYLAKPFTWAAGKALRPVGRLALWGGGAAAKAAWAGGKAAAPHVLQAGATAATDLARGAALGAKVAMGAGAFLYGQSITRSPAGHTIQNMFTGRQLRRRAILAGEVAGIGYAVGKSNHSEIAMAAVPESLPALGRSGNVPSEMMDYAHDPLMGARGGMAFALRRLRHG